VAGSLGLEPSVLRGLPNGMTMEVSGVAATAHSASSAVVVVIAQKHSTSVSEIVAGITDTGGAASTMAPMFSSSVGVRKTG
jgi:hypothetical protein